jgi:hypothetical protein
MRNLELHALRECESAALRRQSALGMVLGMHQITIRTPNPECRLYWYLIEFIDW